MAKISLLVMMAGLANASLTWAIEADDKVLGQLMAVERTYSLSIEDCAKRWSRYGRLAPNDERKAGCVVILTKTKESDDDNILSGSMENTFSIQDPSVTSQTFYQEISFKILPYGYQIYFQDRYFLSKRNLEDFSSVRPMIEEVYKQLKPSYKLRIQTIKP